MQWSKWHTVWPGWRHAASTSEDHHIRPGSMETWTWCGFRNSGTVNCHWNTHTQTHTSSLVNILRSTLLHPESCFLVTKVLFKLLEIRSVERGICPIATSTMNELFSYNGPWTRGLYFHFWCKIWRHLRVSRPRFPLWRENFGDSAVNKR